MKVKSESEVAPSCLTLSNHMDCSLPGSSIQVIFQAKVLEWGAIAFFVIGMKTDLFCPVATAEFSKFAGILSAAVSQHYLLEFEVAQLEFISSTSFVHSDAS